MKLRIDPEIISFRIDFDELEYLLEKGHIQEVTPLANGNLRYQVICLPAGSAATFQTGNNAYILSLSKDIIEAHKATLPSLKGIITKFDGGVNVSLEVNLKKKLKRSLAQ